MILILMEIPMTHVLHPVQVAFLARFEGIPQILHAPIVAEAPFVTKGGFEVLEPVYQAPKSAYRLVKASCSRCGGQGGADAWKRTGYTCYKCGGNGGHRLVRQTVYDRATWAKRDAKAKAAHQASVAKREAEEAARVNTFATAHADLIAKFEQIERPSDFLSDIISKGRKYGSISEAQAKFANLTADREIARQKENENADWVGAIGERIAIEGTIFFTNSFASQFGLVTITGIKDGAGNIYIQKGISIGIKGDFISIKATVKEHQLRDGIKQTIITRPK